MNNIYWTTKTGVVINVDDMDDNHVRNAFKMLLRNINALKAKSTPFQLNGDMAQLFNDSYFEDEDAEDSEDKYLNSNCFVKRTCRSAIIYREI